MKAEMLLMYNLLILFSCFAYHDGAKILGIFPSHSRSHHILGSALLKGLAERGHQVTMFSCYPFKTPVPNYRDVTFKEDVIPIFKKALPIQNFFSGNNTISLTKMYRFFSFGQVMTETVLNDPNFQQLLASEKFDAVIVMAFMNDALYSVAYHFEAPLIVFSSVMSSMLTDHLVGNPSPYAYVPNILLGTKTKLNFKDRLVNTVVSIVFEVYQQLFQLTLQEDIHRTYFPHHPDLKTIVYNTSLVLANGHFSNTYSRPLMPNNIDIGGFHVPDPSPLPNDIQQFLDSAKDGAIYFSMGSNAQSKDMSPELRAIILKTLGGLKQKVLWKFEEDLPGKPANVKIGKWLPQTDILAHPNVQMFITHGGWGSMTEAMVRGVPILGMPLFAEQHVNVQNAVDNGLGKQVDVKELASDMFTKAIQEVLNNRKYRETAQRTAQLFMDREMKPMDRAAYWVEYVIRTGGAPHLRSASLDLNRVQLLLLDVVGALFLLFLITIAVLYYSLKFCCRCIRSKKSNPTISQKKVRETKKEK